MIVLHFALWLLGFAVLISLATLIIELAAYLACRPRSVPSDDESPVRTVVLVPAHNEAAGIQLMLRSVMPQLGRHDRVLVVADNCEDDTARIAGEYPVEVIERRDPDRVGKAWALAFGLDHLARKDPPDVVVVIDADCTVGSQAIRRLANQVVRTGGPVQAAYLLTKPAQPNAGNLISTLAFTVKNVVRPMGLAALGLPCVLTGSGMAFPWADMTSHPLLTSRAGEDLMLTVALAKSGRFVTFCREAVVTSLGFSEKKSARLQRRLWEHTHLDSLIRHVPALIMEGIRQRRPAQIALALEINVPPLSLLTLSGILVAGSAALCRLHGLLGVLAAAMLLSGILMLSILPSIPHVRLTLPTLLSLPWYVVLKVPQYIRFIVRRDLDWSSRLTQAGSRPARYPAEAVCLERPADMPSADRLPEVRLMEVGIHAVSEAQCVHFVLDRMKQDQGGWIITANADILRKIRWDPAFRRGSFRATLVLPAAMSLIWAGRLKGAPLPEMVTGYSLIWTLSMAAVTYGKSVYLLGGRPGTAARTASILTACLPGLKVAGSRSVPGLSSEDDAHLMDIETHLREVRPDIVFVALDAIESQVLISRLRDRLCSTWWLSVGISFDFVTGDMIRPPFWMQRAGLESLHRQMQEPLRLSMRGRPSGIPFVLRLFADAMRERIRSSWRRERSRFPVL